MDEKTTTDGNKKNKVYVLVLIFGVIFSMLLIILSTIFFKPVRQFVLSQTNVSGRVFISGLNLSGTDTGKLVVQVRKHGKQDFVDFEEVKFENCSPWSWSSARKGSTYDFRAHVAIEGEPLIYSNIVTSTAPAIDENLIIDINHEHLTEKIKEEVLASHGDYSTLEGQFDIHGYIPDGSYVDLYAKTIDGEKYELVQSGISPASNSHWQWSGATAGLRYSFQARLINNDGHMIGVSQPLNVSAPAFNQHLRIESRIADSDDTASHATTGQTAVSRKTGISGDINLNGPVKDNSRINVLWRYPGEEDFKVAFEIPAEDGQSWSWPEAQVGKNYEIAACLLEGTDCIATSQSHNLNGPAHNLEIKINSGLTLDEGDLAAIQSQNCASTSSSVTTLSEEVVAIPNISADDRKNNTKSALLQPYVPNYLAEAIKICRDNSGTMGYQKTGSGDEYRACTFKDGHICSAKALADSSCKPVESNKGNNNSGTTSSQPTNTQTTPTNQQSSPTISQTATPQVPSNNFTNAAAQACISHGGSTNQDDPNGTCSFPGGTSCLNSEVFQHGRCISGGVSNTNMLNDGGMEAGNTNSWRLASGGNGAVVTKETGSPGGSGGNVLRIKASIQANPYVVQNAALKSGTRYRLTGFARGNGNSSPTFFEGATEWNGTTSSSWQPINIEFIAIGPWVGFRTIIYKNIYLVPDQYSEWDDLSVREVIP